MLTEKDSIRGGSGGRGSIASSGGGGDASSVPESTMRCMLPKPTQRWSIYTAVRCNTANLVWKAQKIKDSYHINTYVLVDLKHGPRLD